MGSHINLHFRPIPYAFLTRASCYVPFAKSNLISRVSFRTDLSFQSHSTVAGTANAKEALDEDTVTSVASLEMWNVDAVPGSSHYHNPFGFGGMNSATGGLTGPHNRLPAPPISVVAWNSNGYRRRRFEAARYFWLLVEWLNLLWMIQLATTHTTSILGNILSSPHALHILCMTAPFLESIAND
uniref:Transmembrane protein n=1 Tax=Steinernema glaseri TaxID=37863 RepID=A0A1I8ABZ7_9BILA